MTNFERMKSLENEYEMADLIMFVLSDRFSEIVQKDGTISGLPVVKWLQENPKEITDK